MSIYKVGSTQRLEESALMSAFIVPQVVLGPLKAGKLRALAVTARERLAILPDVPTTAQAGFPGLEAIVWNGIFVPAGTPASVVERLHGELVGHDEAACPIVGRNLVPVAWTPSQPRTPMGQRLLPQNLIELYAHALAIERDAFKRFLELERYMREVGYDYIADEFERIGREEQEQYEALAIGTAERELPPLAEWEYAWHYLGPKADKASAPRNAREALQIALASERRAQNFYVDVAEHANDDSVCAFAAEMAVDEQRHVQRLEQLLAREPEVAVRADDDAEMARR